MPEPNRVSVQLLLTIVPPGVHWPLPLLVTVPQVQALDPTITWFEIGSKVAAVSSGLIVMVVAGKAEQLKGALVLQTGLGPESVYCDLPQPAPVVQAVTPLSHDEEPALVQ